MAFGGGYLLPNLLINFVIEEQCGNKVLLAFHCAIRNRNIETNPCGSDKSAVFFADNYNNIQQLIMSAQCCSLFQVLKDVSSNDSPKSERTENNIQQKYQGMQRFNFKK